MSEAEKYGLSEADFNLVRKQAARRALMREEFLKQRTNPYKHAAEAGYVFDHGVQRFMSMRVTQFEFFKPNMRNSIFGICAIVIPMLGFGYLVHTHRATREHKIRTGQLRYKEREFKFA